MHTLTCAVVITLSKVTILEHAHFILYDHYVSSHTLLSLVQDITTVKLALLRA